MELKGELYTLGNYIISRLRGKIAAAITETDPDELAHIEHTFELSSLEYVPDTESEFKDLEYFIEDEIVKHNPPVEMAYAFIHLDYDHINVDIDLEIGDADDDDYQDDDYYDNEEDDDDYDEE